MKKLNIAIVCDPLTHLITGSMISTLRFATRLRERGHKVILIEAKNKYKKDVTRYDGFKVYRFYSMFLPGSSHQYLIAFPNKNRIKQILRDEEIDVVHAIDPTLLTIAFVTTAREMHIKTVAHCHLQPENISLQFPKLLRSQSFNNLVYKYMIWIYRKVDAVVCPSDFGKNMLRKYDKKLKITVVSNGVDLERFKKQDQKNFKKLPNFSAGITNILYVGRLAGEKSVHTLIEAMPYVLKESKKVHLNIVGKGPLRKKLESLAKKLGVWDNITFWGKVPEKILLMLYNASDIFVLPSIAELEGMVVLEAMACGKPLIISDSKLSASSGFVKDNGFTFHLNNPKDLAKKTIILIKDRKLRKKMGIKSFSNVKQYDINRSMDKLERLYNSL